MINKPLAYDLTTINPSGHWGRITRHDNYDCFVVELDGYPLFVRAAEANERTGIAREYIIRHTVRRAAKVAFNLNQLFAARAEPFSHQGDPEALIQTLRQILVDSDFTARSADSVAAKVLADDGWRHAAYFLLTGEKYPFL